jgi:SHS2 domain-containing protein
MGKRFDEVEHTADIAICVRGHRLADLFVNAAYGMACQLAEVGSIALTIERRVELKAYDVETLLVAWLGELLYLGEREGGVFFDFDMLEATPTRLRAVARGGVAREYRSHIKAVTFSDLAVVHTDEGYETTIVFDV